MSKALYINGKVMTMNEIRIAEAFIVEDGIFQLVGSNTEIMAQKDLADEVIDLEGKWVLPGFNDSHMHLISYALSTKKVDLRECQSIEAVGEAIQQYIDSLEENYFGEWIVGHGWNEENFTQLILPTADFLDSITTQYPIFLSRACYHVCAVNSVGLKLAGIDETTLDPEGGKIDRVKDGSKPTGILREQAIYLAYEKIPMPNDVEQLKRLIQSATEDALSVGLTSIQSDDFGHVADYHSILEAYQQLEEENKLHVRMNLQMLLQNQENLRRVISEGIYTGKGSHVLKFGPLKILADGSLGGRTAALSSPYNDDPENMGMLIYEDKKLSEMLLLAAKSKIQPAVHAIGDRTMEQVLNIYKELNRDDDTKNLRPRLIHCQITTDHIIKEMGKHNVIGDIQPGFLPTDLKIIESRVGMERAKESYAWKSMLEEGVKVAGGSDCPIESFNPFLGIYGAVTRTDYAGNPKGGWNMEEALSLEEAISLYTVGSSYATFEENIKGKIESGYLADFIVLKEDVKSIPTSQLKDVTVEKTFVGGVCLYSIK